MSQSAILLCPPNTKISGIISSLEHEPLGECRPLEGERSLQVTGIHGDASWYVTISHPKNAATFIDDYQANEDLHGEFRSKVLGMQPIVLDFNHFEAARELIVRFLRAQGSDAQAFWLDTDYGWVLRGDRLLDKVAVDPNWDWRVEPDLYGE